MSADLNSLPLPDLYRHFAATGLVRRLFELARDEDLGMPADAEPHAREGRAPPGDITTSACIPPDRRAEAALVARGGGVISGLAAIPDLMDLFAPSCDLTLHSHDGAAVPPLTTIATLRGPLDEILELERTMLNLVGRLSGIASRTAAFVSAIPAGSRARLYDTRKTTPGLRVLEKYAVRCGRGHCHRIGLYDAMLIKDNHLARVSVAELPGFVAKAAAIARNSKPTFVEVEVDSLDQFRALLTLPPGTIDIVLLDNMPPPLLREAAALRDQHAATLELEASGGVTLDSIAGIAVTGVDRISTGSITHSAISLDVALDLPGTAH